jgi:Putative glutamine amidotransferase
MFEFFFRYPARVFSQGSFVLLGSWPKWVLGLLLLGTAAGLGWRVYSRIARSSQDLKYWQAVVIWLLESAVVCLILVLLWQPAMVIAELKPQQNVIAILIDDSRSMAIAEDGMTREQRAKEALQSNTLSQLQAKFQTRLYRLDGNIARLNGLQELGDATAPATHIGDGLKQLLDETSDIPLGGVVLLTDGSDNSGGVDRETIAALRNRHIPVHTVGFGAEVVSPDIEMDDAVIAPHVMANSRLSAQVTFHEHGYDGRKATLTVRDRDQLLASREITLAGGKIQSEELLFNAGTAGAKSLQFSIVPQSGERNQLNNSVTRPVNVESAQLRILYVEGEPRWEYKFIRRAEQDDKTVQIVSMLRTTENKIYRQGISDPKELADGFPVRSEDLFGYAGIIIGSVDAGYFSPVQQDLIREFVDRRGGGLLWLGGHSSLADGVWGGSSLVDLLPVVLPKHNNTFHRAPAYAELTSAGTDSLICRLADDPDANAQRWKKLPYLMDYQDAGTPKPGAAVLAEMRAGGRKYPMLITQNYGRGRTAVLATSGTWRWQMSMPLGDTSHEMFWQQLLRWLVSDTPGHVVASASNRALFDDGHIHLSADVRDAEYQPAPDAKAEAHILGPGGISSTIEMTPVPDAPGSFQADWTADKTGSYVAEVTAQRGGQELGRNVVTFLRADGVAENFHTEQNRELLERLAQQTGARYWRPSDLGRLADEVPYSEAGITMRETKDLWNLPVIFLAILLMRSTEWLLRRRWGIV